jgi:hypothetical protein
MANYYQLIARAVAELDPDSPEKRKLIYERARAALLKQLESLQPPPGEIERTKERLALEETFRRIEAAEEKAAERGLSFAQFARYAHMADTLGRLAEALQNQPHGAAVEWKAGVLDFAVAASSADEPIANDPYNRHTHSQLRSGSNALAQQASSLRREQWPGLVRAIGILRELFELPPAELSRRITPVWALTVSLRAYVERNEDALWLSTNPERTLDSPVLRAVKDFNLIAVPWVRRFPSGRALDSDVENWVGSHGDLAAATALHERVARAGLFAGRSSDLILIALDAGHGESVQALRACSWAIGTMQNVGLALVQGLGAAAKGQIETDDTTKAGDADLTRSLEQVVAQSRKELADLLAPLARDEDPEPVRAELLAFSP